MVFSYFCLVLYETNLEHCELLMHQAAAAAENSKNQHPFVVPPTPKKITTRQRLRAEKVETKEGPKKVHDMVVVVAAAVIGQPGGGSTHPAHRWTYHTPSVCSL